MFLNQRKQTKNDSINNNGDNSKNNKNNDGNTIIIIINSLFQPDNLPAGLTTDAFQGGNMEKNMFF